MYVQPRYFPDSTQNIIDVLLFLVFHNCLRNPSCRNFSMYSFIPRCTFSCDSLFSPSAAIRVHNGQLGAGIHTVIRKRYLFWTVYVQQSIKHYRSLVQDNRFHDFIRRRPFQYPFLSLMSTQGTMIVPMMPCGTIPFMFI